MKKIQNIQKIMFITILTMLLAGCAVQTSEKKTETPVQETTQESVKVTETVKETPPGPSKPVVQVQTPPAPSPAPVQVQQSTLSPELKALMDKADKKIISYQYLYSEPPENRFLNTFYIKGNKIKIKLYEYDPYKIDEYFDTVYLDSTTKTAIGKCENKKRCLSQKIDNTVKTFSVNYGDYYEKTPYEWLKGIKTAVIVGPQILDTRTTTLIKSEEGNTVTDYWIDDTYGLPLKIVITKDGKAEMYKFNDATYNHLTESDVTAP